MAQRLIRSVSRRNFIKGAGALSAGLTTALLVPGRASAQQKTLKILQWNHFVPGYDKWFNETYVKAWGEKNNTNVMVDNIGLAGLNSRAAAEVSAQKGHDVFMFLWPPPVHEDQVIDHRELYEECERKYGKPIDLAIKSTTIPRRRSTMASRIVMSLIQSTTVRISGTMSASIPTPGTISGLEGRRLSRNITSRWVLALPQRSTLRWPCAPSCILFAPRNKMRRESGTQIQRDPGGDQIRQGTIRGGHDRRGVYLGRLV